MIISPQLPPEAGEAALAWILTPTPSIFKKLVFMSNIVFPESRQFIEIKECVFIKLSDCF